MIEANEVHLRDAFIVNLLKQVQEARKIQCLPDMPLEQIAGKAILDGLSVQHFQHKRMEDERAGIYPSTVPGR